MNTLANPNTRSNHPSYRGLPWRTLSRENLTHLGLASRHTPSGNSGCEVELVDYLGSIVVLKETQNADYVERLKLQAQKQREARQELGLKFVRIPEIFQEFTYRAEDGTARFAILMEYLNYHDYEDFFLKASTSKIDRFKSNLIQILECELEQSVMGEVAPSVLLQKLEEIENKVSGLPDADSKRDKLRLIKESVGKEALQLPLGKVHGDLTLSNMMISHDGEAIGLFDFLDSYLDSPMLDIAKVRQDTQFLWSRLMSSGKIDNARYEMIMAYLDDGIDSYFQRYDWYRQHYSLIQAINIARIFPYEKCPKVSKFTNDALVRLGYQR